MSSRIRFRSVGLSRVALGTVLLLAFALRLYRLPQQSLSYDEAVSSYLAHLPLREMLAWTAADVQPPLYYLLLQAWTAVAGATEYSLRFISVALSLLAVTLAYRLARGLAGTRGTALAAALVVAVHPWYVWHAQDARMYSLLFLAGLAATLALLRWSQSPNRRGVRATAPALAYAALLYTHYLGAGLIAAHALVVAWRSLRRDGGRTLTRYVLQVVAPAAALFAPWLPATLRTMRSDTSYWVGTLKLDEALRKTLMSLLVGGPGETVLESEGAQVAAVMAMVLVLALLLRRRRDSVLPLAVSALTLAATLAAFLIVPKFNPRYLILASLPLPLLWGQGIDLLGSSGPGSALRRTMGGAALLALAGGSAFGLHGMYADVRLTRADFRSAVLHVLAHAAPDEVPVLVSGHMYPVWLYYAPGAPYLALPEMRVLDVDSSLSLEVAADLAKALEGASGAWLLLWQDEVADPMGAVTFLLDQAAPGDETGFWHVRVRHYRFQTSPPLASAPPEPVGPGCRFESGIQYLGATPDAAGNVALLWSTLVDLDVDLRAQVTISNRAGHEVARVHASPGGDHFPTGLWAPGEVAFVRFDPTTPPAIEGGEYRASLSLYRTDSGQALTVLDALGNPSGETCAMGPITLRDATTGVAPSEAAAVHGLRLVEDGPDWPGVRIAAVGACPTDPPPPGASISLPLLLEIDGDVETAGAALEATMASVDDSRPLGQTPLPGRSGGAALDSAHLVWLDGGIPADAPAGEAEVRVRVLGTAVGDGAWPACSISVAPVSRDYGEVSPTYPARALIADAVQFLGLSVPPEPVSPGDSILIELYFRAVETPADNYSVFLHLLGPDGRLVAEANGSAAGRPTAGWLPGEVVAVGLGLTVPAGVPAGDYAFESGWFLPDVEGMPRASLSVDGGVVASGSVAAGQLTVR